ncbi:3-octaprenyl-4-hydroxybenzoate carboxy-lyase [Legionella massiliensis]|uniref:3-octaprenyl-4-hydroxybenzoate carboxy-lyase n=1 Tax=Legionella massiliensis TaxID=1034943 RepID=A0A078KW89_9GAMM|nr:UbiD family decarboxylase [Legionella massiliensis]CDZ77272.1 3-octaprenyl-4-hydroxybenzoate carboxy-lyase [Legionella massiliensis]CEE13010.1 3-octaprenyl-4-hydroxybenzoate carboxy-lyase [Legionella massiliensis]
MAYADFRDFLSALNKQNDLLEVDRYVDIQVDLGKALQKSAAINGPALVFKNNGTDYPLVGGIYNSRAKALLAFQATEETIFETIMKGLNKPIPPVIVKYGANCENVLRGTQIDLSKLPIPKYSPLDGGPYITAGLIVSQDPETKITDLGNYRFEYINTTSLSFLAQPSHRLGKHIAKAKKMGLTKYHAAIVIGVDPILEYTCQFQSSDNTNDYDIAGGLRGAAVELIKCQMIDLMVPAAAEFVLELEIDLTQQVFEGPLGEYTGYYTPGSPKPVAKVVAITHRNNAYFQALLTGVPPTENHILKQIPFEASVLNNLQQQFPTIKQVAIPASGGVSFYMVIAMEPRFSGEARQAILAAIASNVRPKMVVVVNTDIDVQNPDQVQWAMSFRMQPQTDVIIIGDVPAGPLDPSVPDDLPLDQRLGSALGIDATYPFGSIVDEIPPSERNSVDKTLYFKVAEIPGWQEYNFPELAQFKNRQSH